MLRERLVEIGLAVSPLPTRDFLLRSVVMTSRLIFRGITIIIIFTILPSSLYEAAFILQDQIYKI